ncbi:MAG: hypothetical protein FWH17_06355 [Oscillospiraceae bacterium]|nr:hypothetical protein [Oscillospiraceae bacterium]
MRGNYKYKPEDFAGMLGLPQELQVFYELLECYKSGSSDSNWFRLRNHWENLFFLIKARGVEGNLSPVMAQEMHEYLEILIND